MCPYTILRSLRTHSRGHYKRDTYLAILAKGHLKVGLEVKQFPRLLCLHAGITSFTVTHATTCITTVSSVGTFDTQGWTGRGMEGGGLPPFWGTHLLSKILIITLLTHICEYTTI